MVIQLIRTFVLLLLPLDLVLVENLIDEVPLLLPPGLAGYQLDPGSEAIYVGDIHLFHQRFLVRHLLEITAAFLVYKLDSAVLEGREFRNLVGGDVFQKLQLFVDELINSAPQVYPVLGVYFPEPLLSLLEMLRCLDSLQLLIAIEVEIESVDHLIFQKIVIIVAIRNILQTLVPVVVVFFGGYLVSALRLRTDRIRRRYSLSALILFREVKKSPIGGFR